MQNQIKLKDICFAGGCFWGVEAYFQRIPGVKATSVGYANGRISNPTYDDVCYRDSGHAEAVQVTFNPSEISLHDLLRQFFKIIDPLSVNRQGNDRGSQYRTGIYYTDPEDREAAAEVMVKVEAEYGQPLAVELLPLENYTLAEDYHQDYLTKNPGGYCHINLNSFKD